MARTYQNVDANRRIFGFQCSQNILIGKKTALFEHIQNNIGVPSYQNYKRLYKHSNKNSTHNIYENRNFVFDQLSKN